MDSQSIFENEKTSSTDSNLYIFISRILLQKLKNNYIPILKCLHCNSCKLLETPKFYICIMFIQFLWVVSAQEILYTRQKYKYIYLVRLHKQKYFPSCAFQQTDKTAVLQISSVSNNSNSKNTYEFSSIQNFQTKNQEPPVLTN